MLVTGTVVTGAGPHSGGGKGDEVTRIDLPIPDVARVHGTTVMMFLGVVLVTVFVCARDRAPRACMHGSPCSSSCSSRRRPSATRSTSPTSRRCSSASTSPGATAVWTRDGVGLPRAASSGAVGARPRRRVTAGARGDLTGSDSPMPTPFAFDRSWDFAVTPDELWATLARTDATRVVAVAA